MEALAERDNAHCRIQGMQTEINRLVRLLEQHHVNPAVELTPSEEEIIDQLPEFDQHDLAQHMAMEGMSKDGNNAGALPTLDEVDSVDAASHHQV